MAHQTNRHDELRQLLERLNLGGMAHVFADLALKAAKEGLSHETYLFELAKHEEDQRTEARAPCVCCVPRVCQRTRRFALLISSVCLPNFSYILSGSSPAAC
jgi:hypothetical protein